MNTMPDWKINGVAGLVHGFHLKHRRPPSLADIAKLYTEMTGLPTTRETMRRVIGRAIEKHLLIRASDGTIEPVWTRKRSSATVKASGRKPRVLSKAENR